MLKKLYDSSVVCYVAALVIFYPFFASFVGCDKLPADLFEPVSELPAWNVDRVVDGDSVYLSRDSFVINVRLVDIDAPEIPQPYGAQSKQDLESLLSSRLVFLDARGLDRYNRVLAVLRLADGQSVNNLMIASGSAWHYLDYSDSQALSDLEAAARADRRGLWAAAAPIPPWTYRKNNR